MNRIYVKSIGLIVLSFILFISLAATYKTVTTSQQTTTNNTIAIWDGINANRLRGSGITINNTNGVSGIADLYGTGELQVYSITGQVLQVGTVVGDGSGLSNIDASKLIGTLPMSNLPALYTNGTPTSNRNDMIVRGVSQDERLPVGKFGDRLLYDGTNITWANLYLYWEVNVEFPVGSLPSDIFSSVSGNGGSGPSAGVDGQVGGHYGITAFNTGTSTTNGFAGLITRNSSFIGGEKTLFCEFWVRSPSILPSTNIGPYEFLIGFIDRNSASANVDGAYFYTSPSDTWQFITQNNSTITTNSVTIPYVASEWICGRIEFADLGSSVIFYVNNSPVATNTLNIPTGSSRTFGVGAFINELGGASAVIATAPQVWLDSVRIGGLK